MTDPMTTNEPGLSAEEQLTPLKPVTKAGRMMLAAGLTFHSGRRLADWPETVIAIEQEAAERATLDATRASAGPLDVELLAEAVRSMRYGCDTSPDRKHNGACGHPYFATDNGYPTALAAEYNRLAAARLPLTIDLEAFRKAVMADVEEADRGGDTDIDAEGVANIAYENLRELLAAARLPVAGETTE